MIAALKHVIAALMVAFAIEITTFGGLVVASGEEVKPSNDAEPAIEVIQDTLYTPPIEEEPIPEAVEPEPEETEVVYYPEESWSEPSYDYYDNDCSYEESWSVPSYDDSGYIDANINGDWISGSDFAYNGVHYDDSGYSYTYYSQNVLPGGGLDIPGRHVGDEGYVMDGDGNLCVASDDLPYGTVVNVPFGSGTAVVYDCGSGHGNLDVYVAW